MKKCAWCGASVPDQAVFCGECGRRVGTKPKPVPSQPEQTQTKTSRPETPRIKPVKQETDRRMTKQDPRPHRTEPVKKNPRRTGPTEKKTRGKAPMWPVLIGVAVAIVLAIVVILAVVMMSNRKQKIQISDYVTITVTGSNGHATADYSFDTEKFREDYSGKLEFSESASAIAQLYGDDATEYFIAFYQSGTLSKTSEISNGDTITWTSSLAATSEIAEIFKNCEVTDFTVEKTVEGLSAYVTTANDISEEWLAQMKSTAESAVDSKVETVLNTTANPVSGRTYVGNYFLLAKDLTRETDVNQIILVYRIDYKDGDAAKHICIGAGFTDLVTQADGASGTDQAVSQTYTGDSLDDMYQLCVKNNENEYTCEDHVSDTEAALAESSEIASESAAAATTTASETTAPATTAVETTAPATTVAGTTAAAGTETNQALLYFIEHADSEYFSESYFTSFDKEACSHARNGIYAKMGRKFDSAALTEYFSQFDWYHPTIEADDFKDDDYLNKFQKKNRDVIVAYEKKMGYR